MSIVRQRRVDAASADFLLSASPMFAPAARLSKLASHATGSRVSTEVMIGEGKRLEPHPLRAAVLGEVHARPFTAIEIPRRILHFFEHLE